MFAIKLMTVLSIGAILVLLSLTAPEPAATAAGNMSVEVGSAQYGDDIPCC